MAITKNNLYSEAFSQMKDFIDSHVSDPTNEFKRKFIYASFPNITDSDFQGYPFIVLESPDIGQEEETFDDTTNHNFRYLITVWGDIEADVDSISDEVMGALRDYKSELEEEGLSGIEVQDSPFNIANDQNGEKVFYRPIGIMGQGWI